MKLYLLGAALSMAVAAPHANATPPTSVAMPPASRGIARVELAMLSTLRDPADSLYKTAREALANGNYQLAARLFHEVGTRYPQSSLLPDAMYYEAFAQYRSGGTAAM
mgnify:FL=1